MCLSADPSEKNPSGGAGGKLHSGPGKPCSNVSPALPRSALIAASSLSRSLRVIAKNVRHRLMTSAVGRYSISRSPHKVATSRSRRSLCSLPSSHPSRIAWRMSSRVPWWRFVPQANRTAFAAGDGDSSGCSQGLGSGLFANAGFGSRPQPKPRGSCQNPRTLLAVPGYRTRCIGQTCSLRTAKEQPDAFPQNRQEQGRAVPPAWPDRSIVSPSHPAGPSCANAAADAGC